MKYDILTNFKSYLQENLNKNTAKTYFSAVNMLFKDLNFKKLNEIPPDLILKRVQNLDNKNKVSAVKNGLKYLKMYDDSLNLPPEKAFSDILHHKRNHVKSKGKKVDFDLMQRKVNAIRNKKLKLAYRLASISGLRVSELSDLEAGDIQFNEDGTINVTVKHGKGGKSGIVKCLKDNYVYDNLKRFCQEQDKGKIFYSESYMREKANALGMQMHDFRRAFANLKKMECMNAGATAYDANGMVQEALRHSRFSTTKRYLYGRKIIIKNRKLKKAIIKRKELAAPESHRFKEYDSSAYELISCVDAFDLNDDEYKALNRYANHDYDEINECLYNPEYPNPEKYAGQIDIIKKCIARKKIPDDIILYRGIRYPETFFKRDISGLSVEELNEMFKNQLSVQWGFSSASIDKDVAQYFAGNDGQGALLVMRVPKGSQGIFMFDISDHKEEKEVLLQQKSVMKIDNIFQKEFMEIEVTLEEQEG